MRSHLAVSLFVLSACVNPDAPAPGGDSSEFVFTVPPGSSMNGLGSRLVEEGLAPSEFKWKWYLRSADGTCLKAGDFLLRRDMSMAEVRASVCGAPLANDEPFTVVEGWRIRDIDAALVAKGWIEAGEFTRAASQMTADAPFQLPGEATSYEGYLYPDTYMVSPPPQFTPEMLIERQLDGFNTKFLEPHSSDLDGQRTLQDIVVMASMLEREEPTDSNRARVAGILWKRIDNRWHLGVDATSRYELDEWNNRSAFLVKLRDPNDVYNTRLRPGMPPTPIGNPSITALEAALEPEDSEFWYYLHDANGVWHGGRNAAEHEANRRRYNVY